MKEFNEWTLCCVAVICITVVTMFSIYTRSQVDIAKLNKCECNVKEKQ